MKTELIEQARHCFLVVLNGHLKAIDQGYSGYQDKDIKYLSDFIEETKKRLDIAKESVDLRLKEDIGART